MPTRSVPGINHNLDQGPNDDPSVNSYADANFLRKANAPFTGSLPGAGSQYPEVLTHVLSSSMRIEPGHDTFSARLPAGLLVTV